MPSALLLALLGVIGQPSAASDQQIAFVRDGDIYLAYLDGSDPLRLTRDADCPKSDLAWSPDGTRLVYVRTRKEDDASVADLYLISVSEPRPRLLVDGAALPASADPAAVRGARSPCFADNGETVYFLGPGNVTGNVMRVSLGAGELPAKPEGVSAQRPLQSLALAGNGRVAGVCSMEVGGGERRLVVCAAPVGQFDQLGDVTAPDDYTSPAWSPDGTTLAVVHARRDDICLLKPGELRLSVFLDGDVSDPLVITQVAWRPDGMGLYFTLLDRKSGRPHSIWFAPLDDPYDRSLIARSAWYPAAGGSVKLRSAKAG